MPSEHFSLFPLSASNSAPKSCLKQPNRSVRTPSPVADSPIATKSEGLRGIALQLTSRQAKTIIVEPAQAHIKHSLFCEAGGSRSDSPMDEVKTQAQPPQSPRADSPRLVSMSPSQPCRTQGRSSLADHVVSPRSPPRAGSPQLVRASHALYRSSNSAPKGPPPPLPQRSASQDNVPSLFPVYDHSIPLSQQHYYPSPERVLTLPEPAARRRSSSAPRPALKLSTSSASVSAEPEMASLSQLQALWSAATGSASDKNNRVKKVRLAMHRETYPIPNSDATLDIGFSNFYTFSRKSGNPVRPEDASAEMFARRHHPLKEYTVPIAHVDLAQTHQPRSSASSNNNNNNSSNSNNEHEAQATTIFPQTAALAALESAAASPRANSIAQFDPDASSPQAAQLAFDAVASAKQAEQSKVICTPNSNTDPFGMQENGYELLHPSLGRFPMSIHGQVNLLFDKAKVPSRLLRCSSNSATSSKSASKISLYTPSAGVNKTTGTGAELASLDLSAGVLELDLEAFRKLENKYIIDVAVCALMGVAFMESEAFCRRSDLATTGSQEFAAPPGSETTTLGKKAKAKKSAGRSDDAGAGAGALELGWLKNGRKGHGGDGKQKEKHMGKEKRLPPPPRSSLSSKKGEESPKLPKGVRVVLKLLGFSFKAVVWLLSLGVKVLTKLIFSIGKVARE